MAENICPVIDPGGGGNTQQSLYGEAPHRGPNPYILFLIGKVPLSYTFHRKWYPFHIPMEQLLLNFAPEKPLTQCESKNREH